MDPTISYDIVELPSLGIYYPKKTKSVKVSYLTASDENILSAPNFIKTNSVVTELLKRKVLDKEISIDDMVDEDRNAILIFLRNTSFGSEYKLELTDPKTDKPFDCFVDLSTIKIKDFKLKEDSNGEYSYFLKKSNIDITFKFLTKKQEDEIDKIKESWNGVGAPPIITKQLEFMIQSVGGIRDPMQIRSFINDKLPIKDSQDFRKFVIENKPGLDLRQIVKTPSGEEIQVTVGFGVEFFRPFYGL